MILRFKKLNPEAQIPQYAHESDSGIDIRSVESYTIEPFHRYTFSTGIAAEIPWGHELQVRPRSGLSSKGIVAMWGTVDAGYKGEIGVTLINISSASYNVMYGDKIAQLVLAPVTKCEICETDDIGVSDRGCNGFGSTGR